MEVWKWHPHPLIQSLHNEIAKKRRVFTAGLGGSEESLQGTYAQDRLRATQSSTPNLGPGEAYEDVYSPEAVARERESLPYPHNDMTRSEVEEHASVLQQLAKERNPGDVDYIPSDNLFEDVPPELESDTPTIIDVAAQRAEAERNAREYQQTVAANLYLEEQRRADLQDAAENPADYGSQYRRSYIAPPRKPTEE
jgi:hypothetical protein